MIELVRLPDHKVVRVLAGNAKLRAKLAGLKPCPTEFFRVDIGDGVRLDAWCIKPPDFDPARTLSAVHPCLRRTRRHDGRGPWGGENYLWHRMLAQHGYIVMSIDNRGTPAPRGRAWRKSIYRQIGILASADQAAATREILRERPYLDPARVGIWGWSGGGSMSLNAIFREPGSLPHRDGHRVRRQPAVLRHDLSGTLHGPAGGQRGRLHGTARPSPSPTSCRATSCWSMAPATTTATIRTARCWSTNSSNTTSSSP